MTLTLYFWVQIFNSHILRMGRSIDLEWKRCELDTMLDAQWACSWATMHDKYIGQAMDWCETVTVSNLLAHEWPVISLIYGLRGVVVLWTPCYCYWNQKISWWNQKISCKNQKISWWNQKISCKNQKISWWNEKYFLLKSKDFLANQKIFCWNQMISWLIQTTCIFFWNQKISQWNQRIY